jgi:beta-lactamase class C
MIRKDIVIATVIGILLAAGSARAQELNVEQIVKQKVQPILPKNGEGAGVAVAVHMGGKTSFFNYGMASNAQRRPVTADSIFNLGSVGKPLSKASSVSTIRWPNTLPSWSEAVISAG